MGETPLLQKTKQEFSKPFVLFVGTLKSHKNVPALLDAMERVRRRGLDHELVLAGKKDKRSGELLSRISRLSWVRVLGEVTDPALCCLYNLADLFVLPSFREGFGLPVLEAMACGAPVICSNRSSLPEIAGDAALFFDPLRVDALEELIYNVLINRELREKMSKAGMDRARHFSWEKTAQKTLEVYRRVLG
jgi:glycosyltransferase involved in cell wall biosynthesis